jgi:hypothetical protein
LLAQGFAKLIVIVDDENLARSAHRRFLVGQALIDDALIDQVVVREDLAGQGFTGRSLGLLPDQEL